MRTFVLLLMLLQGHLHAQTVWAPPGTTWMYSMWSYWTSSTYTNQMAVTGDSLIHDVPCQRITVEPSMCTYFDFQGFSPHLFTYASGDSVFWYDAVSDAFRLLVPFDAVAGSSWRIPVPIDTDPLYCDTAVFTVDAVEVIEVDGQSLRRLHVSQEFAPGTLSVLFMQSTGTFTERMGHSYFMLPWILGCADADIPNGLTCYSDPDLSWPDPEVDCSVWQGVKAPSAGARFTIAPDPVERGTPFTIRIDRSLEAGARIDVIDAMGRVCRTEPWAALHGRMTLAEPGAYLLLLRNNGKPVDVRRVVVY